MVHLGNTPLHRPLEAAPGRIVTHSDGDWYRIDHVDAIPTFLTTVVSDADHWLFLASNGGVTAGRVNPDHALFPYTTEDKVIDGAEHTGSVSALLIRRDGPTRLWEPHSPQGSRIYRTDHAMEKHLFGHAARFDTTNADLGLRIRTTWRTSARFGFVRQVELSNTADTPVEVRLLDGIVQLLPAHVSDWLQSRLSSLVDAYKLAELDPMTGLGVFSLSAQIVDRPEPRESLHATTAFVLGLDPACRLLSTRQVERFIGGETVRTEREVRGHRGAYLITADLRLDPGQSRRWMIVADVERTQADVVALQSGLAAPDALAEAIRSDVADGAARLGALLLDTDAAQATADRAACGHHVANVLFNDMRGGTFARGYAVPMDHWRASVERFNRPLAERHRAFLEGLPTELDRHAFVDAVAARDDLDLERLAWQYLPLWFSRRHGDPSRPWNRFDIHVRDARGGRVLYYQGNWRDIFQNWEALCFGYPEYLEHAVLLFANASTADGHNPYRVSSDGIDWEVPNPEDPWSGIGYWGDHQIVYLLKLLEWSHRFHPDRLRDLLTRDLCTYANVPYRLRSYAAIKSDPHDTIVFDAALDARIEAEVDDWGADARLLCVSRGRPLRVNLVEKLVVTTLARLANLVPDAGIWMNTQRPEWNDANNALVGNGVSVVTLCYLRRFLAFVANLLEGVNGPIEVSGHVARWLTDTADVLARHAAVLRSGCTPLERASVIDALGGAASAYRERLYADGPGARVEVPAYEIRALFRSALGPVDASISANRRPDGLFHAYNVMQPLPDGGIELARLPAMLEGQVAALSTGTLDAPSAGTVLGALRDSALFRADQHSYLLYPDREVAGFLTRNRIPGDPDEPWLDDDRVAVRDSTGQARFHPDLVNAAALRARLEEVGADAGAISRIEALHEATFHHRAFTGRSGTMFAYEGLGSIYWHMVGKLLLAVQEAVFATHRAGEPVSDLAAAYYDVRAGLGFNKSPAAFGAFPLDPYSHTPADGGARQPGMTGLVKEEILTRFGELGVVVQDGELRFVPVLLRASEFLTEPAELPLDPPVPIPAGALGFTYCGVPIVIRRGLPRITVSGSAAATFDGPALGAEHSAALFARSGAITRLDVWLEPSLP